MNLTTDKWIPIIWNDGIPDRVSLLDAFLQGDKIRDLSVRPHERIALMRLLICIAQAALDGPKDRDEWRSCYKSLPRCAADYLAKWSRVFELFGEGTRFLQMRADGAKEADIDKLNFVDADMTTLFDQDVTPGRAFEDDYIALRLLTYQAFAAGGASGGSFMDSDGKKKPQKGKNAPCRDASGFHCYVRAKTLIETIYRNLITAEDLAMFTALKWGHPVWELGCSSLEELNGNPNLPLTYLGRLAPVCRSLWLHDDRRTFLGANGLTYPGLASDGLRLEPAMAVVAVKDSQGRESRRPVSAKIGESVRHPWRELHAVLMLQHDGCGGPLALRNVDESDLFDLWLGAFVTDQSKVDDSVEFSFTRLPQEMLSGSSVLKTYADGVAEAVRVETRLRRAVRCYRLALECPVEDKDKVSKIFASIPRPQKIRLGAIVTSLVSAYWTRLEMQVDRLLSASVRQDLTDWILAIQQAKRQAYDIACPHGTPRQLKAYSLGLNVLFERGAASEPPTREEISA